MSVAGLSYSQKGTECFGLENMNSDNSKSQNGSKNLTYDFQSIPKKSSSRMRVRPVMVIVFIVIFGLSCAVAFLSYLYTSDWSKYCRTESCKRAAENLISSMNINVDPCEDFYEFACGNWAKHHPRQPYTFSTDWFDEQQNLLLANISKFLTREDEDEEPNSVKDARVLYKSCLHSARDMDEKGFAPIADVLTQVNLPVLPPFNEVSENFSFIQTVVRSKEVIGQDFFIAFGISSDPENRTINKFILSKPSGQSPLPVHRTPAKKLTLRSLQENMTTDSFDDTTQSIDESGELTTMSNEDINSSLRIATAFYTYVRSICMYAYKYANVEWTEEVETNFNSSVDELSEFESAVDNLISNYYNETPLIPSYIHIAELQEIVDSISIEINKTTSIMNWREYFELIFRKHPDVNLDLDGEDAVIVMSDYDYLEDIFNLLSSTPLHVIEFYMWWVMVTTLAPYGTTEMRMFNIEYDKVLNDRAATRPRRKYCADVANQLFGMAVAYSVIEDDQGVEKRIKKVTEMVNNIQESFLEDIKNLNWMDEKTKMASIRKIKAMKKSIGYPYWLSNITAVEEYYIKDRIREYDFLGNILRKIQSAHSDTLDDFRKLNDFEEEEWMSDPMEANAFNWLEGNTITIPVGIMQFPYMEDGIQALNYGGLGTIIGHEITHGFDNTGKEYDDNGNTNPWWTNETIIEFQNRTKCFVDDYEQYVIPEIKDKKVNGRRTLDENIADNGGIRIAFLAYQQYVKQHGKEKLLKELNYTAEQLFFLAFGNAWCEDSTPTSLIRSLEDEHSPNKVRVWGTVTNTKEFAETWNCKLGSRMNPKKDKCELW